MDFQWIPAQPIDPAVIERMRVHFSHPPESTLSAWFMGDAPYYFAADKEPLEELDVRVLISLLDVGALHISCHGRWEEWVVWFQYLLPAALLRSHETYIETVLSYTITIFFNVYWDGIVEEYPGFRTDALNSLGQALLQPQFWDEYGNFQITALEQDLPSYFYEVNGTFSASMFFCLKYLDTTEIVSWVESLVSIANPYWIAQLLLWLLNADKFYQNRGQLTMGDSLDDYLSEVGLGWLAATYVMPVKNSIYDFTPKVNVELFWSEIRKRITPDLFFGWVETFSRSPQLKERFRVDGLPELFFDRFFA